MAAGTKMRFMRISWNKKYNKPPMNDLPFFA